MDLFRAFLGPLGNALCLGRSLIGIFFISITICNMNVMALVRYAFVFHYQTTSRLNEGLALRLSLVLNLALNSYFLAIYYLLPGDLNTTYRLCMGQSMVHDHSVEKLSPYVIWLVVSIPIQIFTKLRIMCYKWGSGENSQDSPTHLLWRDRTATFAGIIIISLSFIPKLIVSVMSDSQLNSEFGSFIMAAHLFVGTPLALGCYTLSMYKKNPIMRAYLYREFLIPKIQCWA
ncbi:uncharacterized protein LOC131882266 [Tigriopus californicus]|uniref:uncharacterized protein LOC131882266 n=1 Tax=Tigriopus californicus TaxID=6832 RepID=UPI0027DAAF8F|nr:uncharacterized protein LOC131882266 [Tigriopus californicus]